MFERVFDFNASSPPGSRFDAIHFDIEPHQLQSWSRDRQKLLSYFLDLSKAVMQLKAKYRTNLPVGPDIPFWLDTIPLDWDRKRTSVAEHAITLFDFVTLMDYRNHAAGGDGIISHAADELEMGRRRGHTVIIGVETGEEELPKTTFRGRSPTDLDRELAETQAAFRGNPAFGGFAIHHYGAWRSWLMNHGARVQR